MKKIFIILLILFFASVNSLFAQKTVDEYNDSGNVKSDLNDYQGAIQDHTRTVERG